MPQTQTRTREIWVDNVKVIACIFVVLGHYYQSVTKANILPADSLFEWFNTTVYLFHVPLFFICSGYLHQKYASVATWGEWGKNISKKLLDLGVPYVTFTLLTWGLKTVFSSSVNDRVGSVFRALFVAPIAPYWFLVSLFLMFFFTPTVRKKPVWVLLTVTALLLKILTFVYDGSAVPIPNQFCKNYIWFVSGMLLTRAPLQAYFKKKSTLWLALVLLTGFTAGSVLLSVSQTENGAVSFALGILACAGILSLTGFAYADGKQTPVFRFLSRYTMPIFLMHTLFAAPVRILLLKLAVHSGVIHVIAGLVVSFAGPILAAFVMEKLQYPAFFLYPRKTLISIKQKRNSP